METMKFTQSGLSEAQLWAKVDYECRMRGAPFLSYPPVVASSEAAEVIHYITNDRLISNGDLVLMDTGCEYFGYTSDITRCWPVSGKFSTLQRDLYQALLGIHEALLQYAETGVSLNQLYSRMCQLIGQEMKHLGALVENDPTNAELERIVRELCPHHVSHYLGMDVHDTPSISRAKPTEQGMVFTVEPGIYIRRGNPSIKGEFWGIGLRVEDDVAVTESGLEVLTNSCPREAECIETICNSVPTF
ncbi:unnamed protein product [Cyprideis torosa]|uniref:Peptidase M24 domain-containing protein n=1 Tax=Cyprideis torosa TaxID=163714 RepID=A0A7R8WLN1_9CRUS|nr:unnamed protein product [Cyprideis torosa]CAG0902629.1 unnamed protein product [Cyprideis torosa]